jgi:hypothetical protein
MIWIFNASTLNQNFNNSNNQIISFEQKGKFAGAIGENIVLLENKNENWIFTKQYEIIDINQKKLNDDYTHLEISIEFIREFEEKKLLEDYVYSLARVTDFKKPYKHFKRKYSRLTDVEFEAIVDNKIYINRTILGTILNALHIDHQKSFIEYLAQEEPALLTNRPDVDKALNHLYEYVETNIIEPINYLKSSGELFINIFGNDELDGLGFSEDLEKMNNIKMVKPQLELIEKYQKFLPLFKKPERDTTYNTLYENKAFINLFKNARLPITL